MATSDLPAAVIQFCRKLLFGSVIFAFSFLFLECGARAILFVADQFNPYYLTFGFVPDGGLDFKSFKGKGYRKFSPSTYKYQKHQDETIQIKINALGFRGAYDPEIPKPPETYRVVILGESSTFGFYNRDHETFPFYLEQKLREAYPLKHVEVLNMGIPHAAMENISALAEAELAALEPNLVVLYAGCNDATKISSEAEMKNSYRFKDWLLERSVAWRWAYPSLKAVYYSLTMDLGVDIAGLPHLRTPLRLKSRLIEEIRRKIFIRYMSNVEKLVGMARELNVPILLTSQSYTLHYEAEAETKNQWMPYAREVEIIKHKYESRKILWAVEATLLIHSDLMEGLKKIASNGARVYYVDGIAALDPLRDEMLSHVHLSSKANQRLAGAFSDFILENHLIS